jgi:DnaJ-class molecular chaperone
VVEDISDFIAERPEFKYDYVQQPEYHITTKYVTCPNCGGSGQIDDFMTTAGKKTCPRCWGGGNIPEIVEVVKK